MFPIYICWDSSLTAAEQRAIQEGVQEIEPLFGCPFVCYGTRRWTYGSFTCADDIMRYAVRNGKGQANASSILTTMTNVMKDWVEPGAMILFTSQDLAVRGTNWCFGAARAEARMSVQSVLRYRHLNDEVKSACIRRTMRHELGHIFECAKDLTRSHTEMNLGEHCTNPRCSMRQTLDLPTLIRMTGEEDDRHCFCSQCLTDLRCFKVKYEMNEQNIRRPKGRKATQVAAGGIPYGRRK